MLTIAIPTWNRAENLRMCLDSILEQGYSGLSQVKIFVYDNGSTDGTPELLARYREDLPQVVDYRRGEQHLDYWESFREAFTSTSTEWTWMMGDDDLVMNGGLQFVLDVIHRNNFDFFHVAESSRASNVRAIYPGTLLELSETIGFIDMTGFISGNVVRTAKLKEAFSSAWLEMYGKSAFVHSLALMEVLHDSPCAFVDMPVVQLQHATQTEETVNRWRDSNTSMRYNQLGYGLDILVNIEAIPKTVSPGFFRYLGGDLFGKILYTFWCELNRTEEMVDSREWSNLLLMADYLPFTEAVNKCNAIYEYKAALMRFHDLLKNKEKILGAIDDAFERCLSVRYPETYL